MRPQVAVTDANISGIALWQFSDIKVDASNSSSNRPGGINNKGVRRPSCAAIDDASVERMLRLDLHFAVP